MSPALLMFLGFIAITLWITWWAARRSLDSSAFFAALSGNPVMVMVKVVEAPASSLIEPGLAAIEKVIASSMSVMFTVACVEVTLVAYSTLFGFDSVAMMVSVPSMSSSFTALTLNDSVEPTKLESKMSVEPLKLTPAVGPATAPSAVSSACV